MQINNFELTTLRNVKRSIAVGLVNGLSMPSHRESEIKSHTWRQFSRHSRHFKCTKGHCWLLRIQYQRRSRQFDDNSTEVSWILGFQINSLRRLHNADVCSSSFSTVQMLLLCNFVTAFFLLFSFSLVSFFTWFRFLYLFDSTFMCELAFNWCEKQKKLNEMREWIWRHIISGAAIDRMAPEQNPNP